LLLLYTHDDQRDQLIRDPSLIPEAIEECLRLGSNGYFTFPRIATRAPNYDPEGFPDPLRFDITASQSASSHLAPALTIAAATSWVAPPSPSR
jgi:cytochrome P450